MAEKEVDLLGEAIAGTEAEIFGEAVNGVETDTEAGEKPDRSLEAMDEVEETEATEEGDGEAEGEAEGEKPDAEQARDDKGKFAAKDEAPDKGDKPEAGEQREEKPRKGDPTVPLSAERQRRQVAETELEKERRERAAERESFKTEFAKLEGRLDQTLRTIQQPQAPKVEAPKKERPDKFVDPDGYDKWVEDQIAESRTSAEQSFTERFIGASMYRAHVEHKGAFETAFKAASDLDRSNPANVAVLRAIREAPDPGAKLMQWHREQETLREVGGDPAAFKQKIAEETKAQLMQDPKFRQELIDAMKAEAGGLTNSGKPRTITRMPSLNGGAGGG